MGFVSNLFQSFGKGSQTLGTWFGVSKERTSGLASAFGVPKNTGPSQADIEASAVDQTLNAQNATAAAGRKRSRIGSVLSTGAPDAGTAPTQSALAYGKPTLGA